MPSFFKSVRRASSLARRSVRPMLECLEDRNLLSNATFNFQIPSGVGASGDIINFYMYGQLQSQYTPAHGPDANTPIAANTWVYLTDTNGNYDWAAATTPYPTTSSTVPPFETVTVNTDGTNNLPSFSVSLPNTYVISGNIVMGVGTPSSPSKPAYSFSLQDNMIPLPPASPAPPPGTSMPATIATPAPADYPNNIYDFAEFTYNAAGLDTDVTQIDQVGLTYTVTTSGTNNNGDPVTYTMGIQQPLDTLQTLFSQYATGTPFSSLYTSGDLRILAPQDYLESNPTHNSLSGYFDKEIGNFFAHYNTPTNSFTLDYAGVGTFTGQVGTDPNGYTALKLTNPNYTGTFYVYEPVLSSGKGNPSYPSWMPDQSQSSEQMVFAQDGVFNTGGADPNTPTANAGVQVSGATALSDIENAISGAFNRGIATNFSLAPSNWVVPLGLQGATSVTAKGGYSHAGHLTPGTYYYSGMNVAC